MREIMKRTSTNGRWGMAVVSDSLPDSVLESEYGRTEHWNGNPVPGTFVKLGSIEGHETYRLDYNRNANTWVMAGDDVEAIDGGGARIVESVGLQSGNESTLLILGPNAVIRSYGYRRRSSSVCLYIKGEINDIPASVLLALGLIRPIEAEIMDPPPEPSDAMALALRKSGLI